MQSNEWLQSSVLPDGSRARKLLFSSDTYQIWSTSGIANILAAKETLWQKWMEYRLLSPEMFTEFTTEGEKFFLLPSEKHFLLKPVEEGESGFTERPAYAFAAALKETRRLLPEEVSLSDAIYMEKHARLLPCFTGAETADDATVLGTWLSGGVRISTDSSKRLMELTGCMDAYTLGGIITAAGMQNEAAEKKLPKNRIIKTGDFHLPGRPELEKFFNEQIIDVLRNAERYKKMGIGFPGAVALYGPPGSGKTFAVEKLAEFLGWPSYSVNSESIGSIYIHETSMKISGIFDEAIKNAPSIIIIDEMEAYLSQRTFGDSGTHHTEEVSEFLRRIPEAAENHVLVFAMTNRIDVIDPAILRTGRFDHRIEVAMPGRVEVQALLESLLKELPMAAGLDTTPLLDALVGRPLSDAAFAVRETGRLAAKQGKEEIDMDCIKGAISNLPDNQEKQKKQIGFH